VRRLLSALLLAAGAETAFAQVFTHRGFAQAAGVGYPREAANDPVQAVGDVLLRGEAFVKPSRAIQLAAGLDLRAGSHDQVAAGFGLDFWERGPRRPRLSVRRIALTARGGPFTVDVGKQFIRWGKTDVVSPTDRLAPRDFLNVLEPEFLPVTAVRAVAQKGAHTFEAVWAPRLTPSRMPLPDQRWAPWAASAVPVVLAPPVFPDGGQTGLRWQHMAGALEYSLSFFDGFNHLPDLRTEGPEPAPVPPPPLTVRQVHPPLRTYGAAFAVPTKWLTVKGEAAYFTSTSPLTDEYVLYVLQLERQSGEWVFAGGYAGEAVTERRAASSFSPERGLSRSIVARASCTLDATRTLEMEGALRHDGGGVYARATYSQAWGQHWRATATAVAVGGRRDGFLGQYRDNSYLRLSARYSF
jgi:hypothetical protein